MWSPIPQAIPSAGRPAGMWPAACASLAPILPPLHHWPGFCPRWMGHVDELISPSIGLSQFFAQAGRIRCSNFSPSAAHVMVQKQP